MDPEVGGSSPPNCTNFPTSARLALAIHWVALARDPPSLPSDPPNYTNSLRNHFPKPHVPFRQNRKAFMRKLLLIGLGLCALGAMVEEEEDGVVVAMSPSQATL